MTTPDQTVAGADAVAKIVALQAQRITRIEATLGRIEKLLEQAHPVHPRKDG